MAAQDVSDYLNRFRVACIGPIGRSSIRQASERITAVYTEAFNKQDAAGVAGTFTNNDC